MRDEPSPIVGSWSLRHRLEGVQQCECRRAQGTALGTATRTYPLLEEHGYPFIWRDPRVCGKDGAVYASKEAAKAAGVAPLHCGPHCGACSTEHDVRRYKEIGKDVTKVVGPCIFAYFVFGRAADEWCMEKRAQFTPACTRCWIEDHGCLVAHCYHECVFKGVQHYKRMLGMVPSDTTKTSSQETCVACMEQRCSESFISSCGVNRRNAGVETDLDRDEREICKL